VLYQYNLLPHRIENSKELIVTTEAQAPLQPAWDAAAKLLLDKIQDTDQFRGSALQATPGAKSALAVWAHAVAPFFRDGDEIVYVTGCETGSVEEIHVKLVNVTLPGDNEHQLPATYQLYAGVRSLGYTVITYLELFNTTVTPQKPHRVREQVVAQFVPTTEELPGHIVVYHFFLPTKTYVEKISGQGGHVQAAGAALATWLGTRYVQELSVAGRIVS
jgi:hypothetical protein